MSRVYKLALFGNPVCHSLSPHIHQSFASQYGLKVDYQLIKVAANELEKAVVDFFCCNGVGANITLPYKSLIINNVSNISKIAEKAQAINTLYLNDKAEICADNTDGTGFINDLNNRCGFNCQDKKILILGAGGATQGIVPAIMLQQPQSLTVANRTIEKAVAIACYSNAKGITLMQLKQLNSKFDLIIHASSLGHHSQTLKFFDYQIHQNTICYDLSYAQAAVPFMQYSIKLGVNKIYDGLGMLVEQAACAFEIWFGLKPSTKFILKNLS
ncbi:Shikimate 5-dehydrogenase I alpha [hydrothermal vent metagenome]|uniref:shikimate dehydrogenase (NADP(+)) n=1 Tax=hydrothermal vent metagenome TaxID=652676 RepID=A0A3B0VFB0_9ZZZZ